MKSALFMVFIFFINACVQQTDVRDLPLEQSMEKMKEFMQNNPGSVPETPVTVDQNFTGTVLKSGAFENLNYMSSGAVAIEEQNGKLFVVFGDDFTTPNGPDLVVYLTKNSAPSIRADVQNGIELQELKSTRGMQVYAIPENAAIDDYNSVTIHCRAFNVPWSYAPLAPKTEEK